MKSEQLFTIRYSLFIYFTYLLGFTEKTRRFTEKNKHCYKKLCELCVNFVRLCVPR